MIRRVIWAAPLLSCSVWLMAGPVLAQSEKERTQLIMSKLPPQSSANYKAIRRLAGKAPAQVPARDAATISVALNDRTVLMITRTNVDIRPHMCIWRGTVDGTGAPATLMWWPGGKMAGTIEHEGRIFSVRAMGGNRQAI